MSLHLLNRFCRLIKSGEGPSSAIHLASVSSVENDQAFKIEYDYETNDKGTRVVLGRGSFGVVYSGIDMETRKKMAIKEIPVGGGDAGG